MQPVIRFGEPGDFSKVREVDPHFDPEFLRWKLSRQEVILAESEGALLGYLRLEYIWSTVPYIGLIIVKESSRAQGIGKKLLDYASNHLKERGHRYLYSSSQVNEAEPQSWHRHVGFEETGIVSGINEGGIGEVFFRKTL
ncbi:GNAT family N-acetyltransferase [Paenibacillus sp. VCA1]|uniref:GNAT family N-acetyltransferase n=1 Tax=Paenibacillus sp. VCA1 TaxID=3039148 RepID=UPI002870BC9F|nr:GNAT family N-acetyltransferase [Paenibacillus sp. VCA1]MDR9856535.1 GNAT family N-acetyltransferase [Paenibacillus sp. VCA1]